jgi:hypothetical protein
MTLTEALAVKARGLTKEQIIAHLRAVAGNNVGADIRTIERAWQEKPSEALAPNRPAIEERSGTGNEERYRRTSLGAPFSERMLMVTGVCKRLQVAWRDIGQRKSCQVAR